MNNLEYLISNGLTETTEEDQRCYDECMASIIPFTAAWENIDDSVKILAWDSEWEKHINHRAEVIDNEDRVSYLPWNLYNAFGLKWLDGYNYTQTLGDCCGHVHKNALKASNLTNARRAGRTPAQNVSLQKSRKRL